MSAQGMFSIGGIASGLDTTTIISQLMQLERAPIRQIESKQTALEAKNNAWGMVNTKLSALRATVDNISQPDRFTKLIKATSSNDNAVSVVANPSTGAGSLSFYVTALAQTHQMRGEVVADPTAALDGTSFSVAIGDKNVDVALDGTTSLEDVATVLNAANAGFSATVVKVGDHAHRLVLSSEQTGTANALSVSTDSGSPALAMSDLQKATDAVVTLGEGAGAIEIVRPSNTITDLAPGATITLKQTTSGSPVTVSATQDVDAAASAIKSYVDALNGAMNTLSELTKYNGDTGKAGALQGDATARQLLQQLRSTATVTGRSTDGESFHSAYQIGLEIDRYGAVTLDQTKLKEALQQDFAGVSRLFGATGSTTEPSATSVTGTSASVSGTYPVTVTRAADVARATGALYTPPGDTEPKTFRVSNGGKTVTITIDSTKTTAQQAVQAIAAALEQAEMTGVKATATADHRLQLETTDHGTAASFTVEELDALGDPNGGTAFGLAGSYSGIDVEGTINGEVAMGAGRRLSATTGSAEGLGLTWTDTAPSAGTFDVVFSRGLAGGMSQVLKTMEGSTGSVATARNALTSRIDAFDDQIEAFEVRLTKRESTLVKQFTAMETALANLQAQGNWLASQLGSLNGLSRQQ